MDVLLCKDELRRLQSMVVYSMGTLRERKPEVPVAG